MRSRFLSIAGLGITAWLYAAAPARPAKNPVVELVPPGWQAGKMERLPVDAVRRWGGDPAIEREYGVRFLEYQIFSQADQTAEVVAERATDATNAYGLFTYYRSGDMKPEAGTRYAVSGPEGGLLFRGQLFIRADLVPGSEKYLAGEEGVRRILPSIPPDLLGFNFGAEVQTGDYAAGQSHSRVVVITYPTPQIAHSQYVQMQKGLDLNQPGSAKQALGKQEGSFVVLVLYSGSRVAASRWMELFNRRIGLSWDRPYPGDKPPLLQMLNFIVLNIIFVFYLCGWSVFAGVIFYLSKQAARKWFPQTDFGQPDEARFITLKLS